MRRPPLGTTSERTGLACLSLERLDHKSPRSNWCTHGRRENALHVEGHKSRVRDVLIRGRSESAKSRLHRVRIVPRPTAIEAIRHPARTRGLEILLFAQPTEPPARGWRKREQGQDGGGAWVWGLGTHLWKKPSSALRISLPYRTARRRMRRST